MKCSICNSIGHNKRSCNKNIINNGNKNGSGRNIKNPKRVKVKPLLRSNTKSIRMSSDLSSYDETIKEITRIAKDIELQKSDCDGRIDSAMKEIPFLKELKTRLHEEHPIWDIVISPPRASCDVMINSIRINLKLTDCKSSDNSMNKPSIYYSITGLSDYPYSSTWNDFIERIHTAKSQGNIKIQRNKSTEYHYLVKNKLSGDVLLKPIFDIHAYVSNASNDLQINWKNEFIHRSYNTSDSDYLKKVESLLSCIQKSVKEMIQRTKKFAEMDLSSLFNSNSE